MVVARRAALAVMTIPHEHLRTTRPLPTNANLVFAEGDAALLIEESVEASVRGARLQSPPSLAISVQALKKHQGLV